MSKSLAILFYRILLMNNIGTVPNPNANIQGAPATIPNPGYSIPAICEKRLVSASYTAGIYDMIGRSITQLSMAGARLKKFDAHNLLVSEHEDPEKLPVVSKSFGIMKAMDLVPSHLRERLGVRKVALSYVIRTTVAPAPIPVQANNSPTSADYDSIMDELLISLPILMLPTQRIMPRYIKYCKTWYLELLLNRPLKLFRSPEMDVGPT